MDTTFEASPSIASTGQDFAELSRQVRDDGLLGRRRGYYSAKIVVSLAALGAVAAAVVLLGNTWWVLVAAAVLAFVLTQLGFIGHDAGHRQICVASTRQRSHRAAGSQSVRRASASDGG